MSNASSAVTPAGIAAVSATRPDRLILVYDGDSGLRAMLLDIVKKAAGREDCPLCEIVYSPLGKRSAWVECAARLQIPVAEMHRDELPEEWGLERAQLPCVLGQIRHEKPYVLVPRAGIARCEGDVRQLEDMILTALSAPARI